MRDKEFDRLFNSKLGDFEVEPSPMVWDNIANGLQQKKRKLTPYLSIAASVIVLVSAGLLFFSKTESNTIKPVKQNRIAVKMSKPVVPANLAKNNVEVLPEKATNKVKLASKYIVFIAPKVVAAPETPQIATKDNASVQDNPIQTAAVLTNANPTEQVSVITEPVQSKPVMMVPGKETSFALTANDSQEVIEKTQTAIETINAPVKKRGIHSLGGLIGAIVAKVDKREDKLIEFTESDEDRSTITGINLGLIKIKKK